MDVQARRLKVRETVGAKPDEPALSVGRAGGRSKPIPIRPKQRRVSGAVFTFSHIASWVIFFVLGGIMAGLRYGGWLDPARLEMMRSASFYVAAVVHVVVVLTVLHDSVLAGIIGLLLPPYALYYLFARSDRFFIRALVAGILIGVGQDAMATFSAHWVRIVELVHAYIRSGG
ncbi:MAG: hypothetical protein FJ224_00565 [Lentisphaerae bacterium]|nr:hypothetical protein [Lentisphaerota bacterium]